MNKFTWLKVFNSPFITPKIKWYIGKIRIGTPYFFPRKWVKDKTKLGHYKAVPKTIGFDFVDLGWKTKWEDTDYRYEWSPLISFVFFKWQIAAIVYSVHPEHYWTAWLCYERDTDKAKSKKERLAQCRELFPNIWIVYEKDKPRKTVNYYDLILKRKYL